MVIPTRYRTRELERCLRAVGELEYPRFEILVVDNSSGDAAAHDLAERWAAQYVVEPRLGVSFARNCGARLARGEIVAYVDDDAVPQPGWLTALTAEFDDPAVIAVAGPYLPLEPVGAPSGLFGGVERKVIDRTVAGWFELAAFSGFARAGNMALRSKAFERWLGFEPRLGRGTPLRAAEDDYAVLELVDLGYRIVYTPDAVVRHSFPCEGQELSDYQKKFITEKALFVGFLLTADRRYSRQILKYLFTRLSGYRLRYGQPGLPPSAIRSSRSRELAAGLKGLLLYAALQVSGRIPRRRDAEFRS